MIYGEEIQINFKKRIRDEIRFESSQQLIEQIQKDVEWAQENVFRNVLVCVLFFFPLFSMFLAA